MSKQTQPSSTNGRVHRGRAERQPLPKRIFESSACNPWFVGVLKWPESDQRPKPLIQSLANASAHGKFSAVGLTTEQTEDTEEEVRFGVFSVFRGLPFEHNRAGHLLRKKLATRNTRRHKNSRVNSFAARAKMEPGKRRRQRDQHSQQGRRHRANIASSSVNCVKHLSHPRRLRWNHSSSNERPASPGPVS